MSAGILTNAGRDLFAAKQGAGQTLVIDRFLLANISGLDPATAADPDEALPIVGDRVAELAVTKSGYVNADKVVYSLYLGTLQGDYTFNWVGLLADDDTLVAVRYIDPVNKYATSGQNLGNAITRNFLVTYTDAQAITNITVDAATWQLSFDDASETVKGLVELADATETQTGTDSTRAVTPAGLASRTATESRTGLAEIATQAETDAGTDDARIVTAKKLASRLASFVRNASTTAKGFVELATNSETQTGTDSTRAVTPAGLASRTATESRAGLAEVASQTETNAGTDDSRIVTPKKLAAWLSNALSNASSTVKGIVELATNTETQTGTDSTRAVTPAGLASRTATESRTGLAEIATQAETDTGTDDARIVTAKKLASRLASFVRNASTTAKGFVELATNSETQTGTDSTRAVTPAGLAASLINTLTSTSTKRGLTAAQGKALKDLIDGLGYGDVGAAQAGAVVVSSGSNSNGYYRIWSDGYTEQWGYKSTNLSVNGQATITFPVGFQTLASVVFLAIGETPGAVDGMTMNYRNLTVSNVIVNNGYGDGTVQGTKWKAEGY